KVYHSNESLYIKTLQLVYRENKKLLNKELVINIGRVEISLVSLEEVIIQQ
ncbi:11153_t:CDS:1, partial [Scutellospora calospora]